MGKHFHEIRDPIHTFIRIDSEERKVLDSRPLQRLRHVHQLAMTQLVYPSGTHRRFEHSLGVMELADRIFSVLTDPRHPQNEYVSRLTHDQDRLSYWRRVLRMAALCHDIGHLPFSHAAENRLLPNGWDHERITAQLIAGEEMQEIWRNATPPLRPLDIIKLAIGPKKCSQYGLLKSDEDQFDDWQAILSEIITGDAFGADRMDYLLRDSHHTGVAYGRFDHHRLVDTLRILPKEYEDSDEPALGVDGGGIHSAEALLWARFLMYTQVYFHSVTRAYEVHLGTFLSEWLGARDSEPCFFTETRHFLETTDNEIMAAILEASRDPSKPGHQVADRIVRRKHFRLLYELNDRDIGANPDAAHQIYDAAREKYGKKCVAQDHYSAKGDLRIFPVRTRDGKVVSSLEYSKTLERIPAASFHYVFIDPDHENDAKAWLAANKQTMIQPRAEEDSHG